MTRTITQMKPKILILRERSQTKSTYWMIPFTSNSGKCKLICHDRKQISGYPRVGERGEVD